MFSLLDFIQKYVSCVLELNSPKAAVTKVAAKPQDPIDKLPVFNVPNKPPTTGNGVSVNDCKEYLISLEKELGNLLKCKPYLSMKGMKNMGINLTTNFLYYLLLYVKRIS